MEHWGGELCQVSSPSLTPRPPQSRLDINCSCYVGFKLLCKTWHDVLGADYNTGWREIMTTLHYSAARLWLWSSYTEHRAGQRTLKSKLHHKEGTDFKNYPVGFYSDFTTIPASFTLTFVREKESREGDLQFWAECEWWTELLARRQNN